MKKFLLSLTLLALSVIGYTQGKVKVHEFLSSKQQVQTNIPKLDTTEKSKFTIITSRTDDSLYISFSAGKDTKSYRVDGLQDGYQNDDSTVFIIAVTNITDEADKLLLGIVNKGDDILWFQLIGPNKSIIFYLDPTKK